MARITEHLDTLRAKPHHVRRRIALGSSVAITTLVVVGWIGAMASSDRFALTPIETPTDGTEAAFANSATNFSQLMGAAGAALGASSTSTVEVVDTQTRTTLPKDPENFNNTRQSTISF